MKRNEDGEKEEEEEEEAKKRMKLFCYKQQIRFLTVVVGYNCVSTEATAKFGCPVNRIPFLRCCIDDCCSIELLKHCWSGCCCFTGCPIIRSEQCRTLTAGVLCIRKT